MVAGVGMACSFYLDDTAGSQGQCTAWYTVVTVLVLAVVGIGTAEVGAGVRHEPVPSGDPAGQSDCASLASTDGSLARLGKVLFLLLLD